MSDFKIGDIVFVSGSYCHCKNVKAKIVRILSLRQFGTGLLFECRFLNKKEKSCKLMTTCLFNEFELRHIQYLPEDLFKM